MGMSSTLSRRFLVGGLLASAATAVCAKPPARSPRPPARPVGQIVSPRPPARPVQDTVPTAPDSESLIADARLGGDVAYVVADAHTGTMLEGRNTRDPMAPASTAKTLTTLYAFDRLGQDYRFTTRLVADGPISGDTAVAATWCWSAAAIRRWTPNVCGDGRGAARHAASPR